MLLHTPLRSSTLLLSPPRSSSSLLYAPLLSSSTLLCASGIIVKVVNKKLAGGKYHKRKGEVERVVEKYTAHVRMQDSGDLLKLDQEDLETVIPSVGGRVRILNGKCRGSVARLTAIDEANFCVAVEVEGGTRAGTVLSKVEYEDVCKMPSSG